jgi:hypothetical protein
MSRRLKRQLGRANGGRGALTPSSGPARARSVSSAARTPQQRLNRILLIGGGALAVGAVGLAIVTRNPGALAVNLGAIGVGLLMGKGIGMFMFRRILPAARK